MELKHKNWSESQLSNHVTVYSRKGKKKSPTNVKKFTEADLLPTEAGEADAASGSKGEQEITEDMFFGMFVETADALTTEKF